MSNSLPKTDLGLTQVDADALDLPRERDPTKSPDKWRTELNALTVLKDREGIDEPLLAYVAAKMSQRDAPLAPLPIDDPEAKVRTSLQLAVKEALADEINAVVDDVLDEFDSTSDLDEQGSGPPMQLRTRNWPGETVDLGDLRDELANVARAKRARLLWWRQTRYEASVKEEIGTEAIVTVADRLERCD